MYGITKIDTCEDIALVSFKKVPLSLQVLADIFRQFADAGIIIDMISQTAPTSRHISISFTCRDGDMVKVLEISKALNEKYPEMKPMVSSGNCKIQLFGEKMPEEAGVFAKVLECLSATAVELHQVTTSEVDISLLVGSAHLEEASSALRKTFDLSSGT